MMGELWTPPGARPGRWESLRHGDKALDDGRILRDFGPISMRSGRSTAEGRIWETDDGQRVIATVDQTPLGDLLHVSTSFPDRDPSWQEILDVRYAFYGDDIDVMMVLPRRMDYVNVHKHTFHLQQTPSVWGMQ
jgi:hypothetical protein